MITAAGVPITVRELEHAFLLTSTGGQASGDGEIREGAGMDRLLLSRG